MVNVMPCRSSGMRPKPQGNFDESPLLVFYELTRACDLACSHCRACAQAQRHPSELSTAEAIMLIDQLTEFPMPPMLVLTGGDPLKRDDLYDLVEHAAWSGLDVSLTPSATPLVTRTALRRLRDAGISRLAISLDGADAATHDTLRGVTGSFDRSLEILKGARTKGIPTQVNTTLTPSNFAQLDAMADLLATLDIDMWSLFFLVPVGRAAWSPRLTAEQCEQAFAALWRQSQQQPYAIKTTEAPHYRRFVLQQQRSTRLSGGEVSSPRYLPLGVNDGKGTLFVSHVGLIHPSGFLPVVCGLFPLEHIVNVYQRSPIFRALRDPDRLEGKCQVCEYRRVCGGSRARAYAVTGNAFSQEPDCSYVPAVTQPGSAL
jgi:radical SAM protein